MNGLRDPQASDALNPNPGGNSTESFGRQSPTRRCWGTRSSSSRTLAPTSPVLTGGWRRETASNGALREWYVDPIDSHAIRGDNIYWRRPKNKKPIPMSLSRQPPGVAPGMARSNPAPMTRAGITSSSTASGAPRDPLNPLRFRHTCGVLLFHVHKQPASVVELLLGVSPQVVSTYIAKPPWAIAEELRASGF